jgi:hypothetical protein
MTKGPVSGAFRLDRGRIRYGERSIPLVDPVTPPVEKA